jgi:Family of unknown function (DUF5681)
MAKFVKGQSGNPKGRPKTETRSNEELRRMIREFVSGNLNIEDLQKDFDKITKPELKFKIRLDFIKMLLPDPVSPEKLSEEDYQEIIKYFQNKINE